MNQMTYEEIFLAPTEALGRPEEIDAAFGAAADDVAEARSIAALQERGLRESLAGALA